MPGEADQEKAMCRFCLNSRNTTSNPLITPCECNGSLRYVHLRCLNKWMLFNPNRVVTNCELCLHPFLTLDHPSLEIIPVQQNYSTFILRYPFLLSLTTHYAWLIHTTALSTNPRHIYLDPSIYIFYQWLFQILYFGILGSQWDVKNMRLYLHELNSKNSFLFVFLHLSLILGIYNHYPVAGPLMNIYINIFWRWHTTLLERVNERLLRD